MLDVLTTALESAAVVLLVVAVGWSTWILVPAPTCWPAALAASGVTAWLASWALQWLAGRDGGES